MENKKHDEYKRKISETTYSILDKLYNCFNNYEQQVIREIFTLVKEGRERFYKIKEKLECQNSVQFNTMCKDNMEMSEIRYNEEKLRAYVMYTRYCNIIDFCIKQSCSRDEIDYYLYDNSLKELNMVGISFYIDTSLKRHKSYLYRCEGKNSTWDWEKIKQQIENYNEKKVDSNSLNIEDITKDEIVQLIIYLAVVQIKKDFTHLKERNIIAQLRSYSKCLGRDLHRYCSEPNSKNLIIRIEENADINVVYYEQDSEIKTISLQEFVWRKDINIKNIADINFCISTCDVRGYKNDNLISWITNYLPQKYTKEWLKRFFVNVNAHDNYLTKENLKKDIIGTIADKEVVVSKKRENCEGIEFEFNKDEFYLLLFMYYKQYVEEKMKITHENIDEYQNFVNNIENSFKSSKVMYCNFYKDSNKCNDNIKCVDCTERSCEMKRIFSYWEKIKICIAFESNPCLTCIQRETCIFNNSEHKYINGNQVGVVEYIQSMLNNYVDWEKEIAYMNEINMEMEMAGNGRVGYTYMYKENSLTAQIWKLSLWTSAVNKRNMNFSNMVNDITGIRYEYRW